MISRNPTVNRAFGLDLIEIIWETRAYTEKEKEIQRSVWERFFSLPWKPFEKVKTILVKEPAMFSYQEPGSGKTIFICHPALREKIRNRLQLSLLI